MGTLLRKLLVVSTIALAASASTMALSMALTAAVGSKGTLSIDGAQQFQTLDGFGVNANSASWHNGELRPALDLLVDQLGATIFRVVVDNADWEETNDNADPGEFNWTYYTGVYTSPKFEALWHTMAYLNQKGIGQHLMLNVMGPVAAWMGGSRINTSAEDEWVEMVASLVYYARQTRGLQFGLFSPMNEPDWDGFEGPQVDQVQYGRLMQKLSQKLDALGLSAIRLVGPDTASVDAGVQAYVPEMLASTTLMAKLAHFGLHNYAGYTAGADEAIKSSAYPGKNFWMTEVSNIWDAFPEIAQGAAATLVWDGYDSVYNHAILAGRGSMPPNDAGNGPALLAYDTTTGLYTPRKAFYEHMQLFKYVEPGARRIAASDSHDFLEVLAFSHPRTNRITIVGRHSGSADLTIDGTLANLPSVTSLQWYMTDASANAQRLADVPVSGDTFTVTVTAGSTFTLTTASAEPPPDTIPPAPPTGLTIAPIPGPSGENLQALISWVAPATDADGAPLVDLVGYRVYYGQASGVYTSSQEAGEQTTTTLAGLEGGQTHYVSVTALDTSGNESGYAEEVSAFLTPGCMQGGSNAIWGRVTTAQAGLPGVILTLHGPGDCQDVAITSGSGLFRFAQLSVGAYTLTPTVQACFFTPASQAVEITQRLTWVVLHASCP